MKDWIAKKIILTFILIVIVFTLFLTVPWTLIHAGAWFMPRPSMPEITRGEFPFRIEYKINGEKFIIEDVFIAEFDGFAWDAGQGRHRLWKGWVEGTGEFRVLIPVDEMRRLEIVVGRPETYMNDRSIITHGAPFPQFIMITYDYNQNISGRNLSVENLYEQHGVKIINYEFSEPIVNSFR